MQNLRTLGAVLSLTALGSTLSACGSDEKDLAAGTNVNGTSEATVSATSGSTPQASATGVTPAASSAPAVNPKPTSSVVITVPADAIVGESCKQDSECGTGLHCLTSEFDFIGGTIAGGSCSLECQDDPSICTAYGAECLGSQAKAYCVPGCTLGEAAEKCHGRADMVCIPFVFGYSDGACFPMCQNTQASCGENLECLPLYIDFDPNTYEIIPSGGVCGPIGTVPPEWKKDGEPCTSSNECEGLCAPPVDDGNEGYCTSLCNFLSEGLFCNADPAGAVRSVCLNSFFGSADPTVEDRIPSELGYCTPTCDSDEDCKGGNFCNPLKLPETQKAVGHTGLCQDPSLFTETTPATDMEMSSPAEERLVRALSSRLVQPQAR